MAASEAGGPGAESRTAPPGAKARRSALDADALVARLRAPAGGTELPLDALDRGLRAILDATGAAAGAVCLYDTRGQLLRLAAEHGLSDEGCRRLRTVRRGDAVAWDMPLHGLVNRRVYLIDSAARNRYVPPLVESPSVRTVACLPMYAGSVPQGSLILVMVAPAALREEDVRALDHPIREFGRLIEIVRRQVSGVAVPSRDLPRGAGDHVAERPAPVPAGEDGGARVAALTARLAAARREQTRLEAENERLRREAPRDDARVGELTAEVDRLRSRLAEAEAGAAHEHRAREELEATLQRDSSSMLEELRQAREAVRRADAARGAAAAENARLTAELEWARHEADRIEPLVASLARAEDERARLAAALESLQAEQAAREQALAARETNRDDEHAAALERLQARLAEAEDALARERRAREADASAADAPARDAPLAEARALLAAAESARDDALRELAATRANAARAESVLAALQEEAARHETELARLREEEAAIRGERDRLARELDDARRRDDELTARLAERGRELESLRAERAEDLAGLERLGGDVDALRARVGELELERGRLAAEVEGAAAARQRLEEALEQGLAEARARTQESEARLAEREQELDALRTERAAEAARLEELVGEADGLRVRVAELERERGRLAAEVEGGTAARARLEEALARGLGEARAREHELVARLAERDAELDTLRSQQAAEAARRAELIAETDRLRARAAELELECGRLGAEVEGAAAARARLEEALDQRLAEARTREQELTARLAERERELAAVRSAPPDVEPPAPPVDERPAKAEPAPAPAPAGGGPTRTAPRAAARDGLTVVLDAAGRWEASATNRRIAVVAVDGDAVGRASDLDPADVLVNLAQPRALTIATQLRAAGAARFWGCMADAAAGHGVLLGPVEPVARPLDPDSVLAQLERHGTRSGRVLTVGEDVDAFISLRQALIRRRMSVSMAWNAKQAVDLLPMVRPDVVVLDLGLAPGDASPVVGLLAASTPPPVTVLVAGGRDAAPVFAMALAAAVGAGPVASLADLLRRMQAGAAA